MFQHKLAYRFSDNSVEGFTSVAFGQKRAKQNAIQKVKNKIEFIRITREEPDFDESRLISGNEQLTQEEIKQIAEDWKID